MNILITGLCGGLGSTLAFYLQSKGYTVWGVDNLNNGYVKNLVRGENMFDNFAKLDIRDTESLINILNTLNITDIIHLAAITSLPVCEENPSECFNVNTQGTLSVLEAARKTNIKNIVFASTSAVYENTINHYLTGYSEYDEIENPTLAYSLSKKLAEDICISYRKKYDMNIAILRYFNVFGPYQDIHRKSPPLINYICRELLNNRMPLLHSDGKQQRDYVHANDVCRATLAALGTSDTYNVCSGKLVSVSEIYNIICETLGSTQHAAYNIAENLWQDYDIRIDKKLIYKEVNKTCLGDNDKIKRELGITINDNIEELIAQTVLEIKTNHEKT